MRFLTAINKMFLKPLLLGGLSLGIVAVALIGHLPAETTTHGMSHDMRTNSVSNSPECKMLCGGMSFERLKKIVAPPELEREPVPPLVKTTAVGFSSYVLIIVTLYLAKKFIKIPIYEMNSLLRI